MGQVWRKGNFTRSWHAQGVCAKPPCRSVDVGTSTGSIKVKGHPKLVAQLEHSYLHKSTTPANKMSQETKASIKRMSREQLSSLLLSSDASKIAVIDVRDHDYPGGHIKTSTHIPSSSLDHTIPEIVRKMAGKEIVIFHCALSQQRGPSAALRYLRERESKRKTAKVEKESGPPGIGIRNGAIQKVSPPASKEQQIKGEIEKALNAPESGAKDDSTQEAPSKEQEVYVLDQGFVGWQEKYGKDQRLTEDYAEDIWIDYN